MEASRYITGLNCTSVYKVIVVWSFSALRISISSVSIYYRIQSDIRVKSYFHLNLLGASVLNFEHLDICRYSIGLSRKKLLSLEFALSFCFPLPASWYITGLNRTSELKVIGLCICYLFSFSISSVSIYYWTQSDIRVKRYCRLNLIRASVFNLQCLNILRTSVGHLSKKLLSFEFARGFRFQFGASRYITGLNRTSV